MAAVEDGLARAGPNGLGGNVVWLRGDGRTFYDTHLDRQAIEGTARVRAGDALDYVGNTGNARPPRRTCTLASAIDPLLFVQPDGPRRRPPCAGCA